MRTNLSSLQTVDANRCGRMKITKCTASRSVLLVVLLICTHQS